MIMKIRVFLKCVVLFSILFLTGCGDRIRVEGMVSFPDGTPLPTGKIIFEDATQTFTADINKDGKFRMGMLRDGEGLPAGKYNVAILNNGREVTESEGKPTIVKPLIAEKFRSIKTSGIEYEVKSSNRNISIIVERP
jgi:hypothetical protein